MGKKTVQTITDIAQIAKVSKSTVSRALNDSPLVKAETKEQIRAIARQYNFRLNAPARRLSLKQSYTVAFVTHAYYNNFSLDDLFTLEIMGGVSNGLHELGYDMLVIQVNPRDADWPHHYLDSGRVDGFILATGHADALASLETSGLPPAVYVDAPAALGHAILLDSEGAAFRATEHLIQHGHRRIGMISGPLIFANLRECYRGYVRALEAAGLTTAADLVAEVPEFSIETGRQAAERLLNVPDRPTAIFGAADQFAIGAMQAVRCHDTVISERFRPSRSQCSASASSLRWRSAGGQMMFDSSAYWATIRSVLRSPPPPIITGMRPTGGGSLIASLAV